MALIARTGSAYAVSTGTQARTPRDDASPAAAAAVDLYWIPLGAGQHVVRLSGKLFEAIGARLQRRRPCDLYHSALVVVVPLLIALLIAHGVFT